MERLDFDHSKLEGMDVNIEISLKEYGLAWIVSEKETLFYYGLKYDELDKEDFEDYGYIRFDFCSLKNNIDVKKEYEWVNWENLFESHGIEEEDFNQLPLPFKIENLVSHYGRNEIFGESYWEGLKYEEIVDGGE